jgi:hypothetical protein
MSGPNVTRIVVVRHKCALKVIAKDAANAKLTAFEKVWRRYPQAKNSRQLAKSCK